jgi:hypothetical protein
MSNNDTYEFLKFLNDESDESVTESFDVNPLTEEDKAVIFLEALYEECTDEEFQDLLVNHAYEMAMAGLVPDANICQEVLESLYGEDPESDVPQIATEAMKKKIIINNYKAANFNKIQKRTAIRLAGANKDPHYNKYVKYRKLMIQERIAIYKKYLTKSKAETKKIIKASKNKASTINSHSGKSIEHKMDAAIKKVNKNGRN